MKIQLIIYDNGIIRDFKNYDEYNKIQMIKEIETIIIDYPCSEIRIVFYN